MDMAVANLFKHKVHFSLIGHDGDQNEPFLCSKGYHYVSNKIENGKSIGFKSTHYLFGEETRPLFTYILSTMEYEMKEVETPYQAAIRRATIRIHLIREEDHKDYIIYVIECEDFFSLQNCERVFHMYPRNLVDNKFSIYVEAYVYYTPLMVRDKEMYDSESPDEEEEYTPLIETYRQDYCVVCLESKLNILYLNCMHIAICDSCDRLKKTVGERKKCDVCRAEISRRIKI